METKTVSEIPRATLEKLLSAVPFYKTVRSQEPWQFEVLLKHSRLVSCAPGEIVLNRGERDAWLYFLLKGQLAVYAGDGAASLVAINQITPGEVFGDLAMLGGLGRTATLVADPACKQVLAFGTDFTVFGELADTRVVSLYTKLAYYRNMVHSLRWKLEVYRMKYPQHSLSGDHRRVRLFTGTRDTFEELQALHDQALSLTRLLVAWNREFGGFALPPVSTQPAVAVAAK
ncbi:cyclic nucleotide-binding domain-containing protein [Exilibacterium tricleocarpae]|uniref:Cyclic nucleotide-binding domain-containing protein n=1 Tax=Exilibacterium tricleocarpae TaxID=2591008 RepID=A0A545TSE2_9GAMM|nr:cyclic nucleotide-binding domain-containing protein [Exilibacterium tricleocarpae]TQV80137.1 cyclic nucleotide-binding domain-containing protein [Exilibacterium tricleocarpae]